jgi:hypothetical protein
LFVGQYLDSANDLFHAVLAAIIQELLFIGFLQCHPELQDKGDHQS